jgi:hypothetical protein
VQRVAVFLQREFGINEFLRQIEIACSPFGVLMLQRLELLVLFLELSQAGQLGHTEAGKLLLPAVEGLFRDSQPAADFKNRSAGLSLS